MRRILPLALLALLGACAMQPAGPTPLLVFFTNDSAEIDPAAMTVIRHAADMARAAPGSQVSIIGYADPVGAPPAMVALSRLRAQQVADMLVADGVPESQISHSGSGQPDYQLTGVANRRVDIHIAP